MKKVIRGWAYDEGCRDQSTSRLGCSECVRPVYTPRHSRAWWRWVAASLVHRTAARLVAWLTPSFPPWVGQTDTRGPDPDHRPGGS